MSISSTLLGQVFTRKLFAFAGNTLLVYDYFLTFSLEVAYIWNAPWSFVKGFFLINRYGNLIGQTLILLEETGFWGHGFQEFCLAFAQWYAFFAFFSGESIRILVLIRTCTILGCKRRIALLWATLYSFYAISILVVSIYLLRIANPVLFSGLGEVGVCLAPVAPGFWVVWLIPLFLDGLILGTTCCSLYRLTRWFPDRSPSKLTHLLARDAVMFYSAALFNVLSTIICWTIYRESPKNFIGPLISYPVLSTIGQRLVLNLRCLQAHPNPTRDLSREINRQIAALRSEQSDYLEFNLSLELDRLGFGNEQGAV